MKGLNENHQFLYISYSIEVTCYLHENTILLKYFLDENEVLEGRFPTWQISKSTRYLTNEYVTLQYCNLVKTEVKFLYILLCGIFLTYLRLVSYRFLESPMDVIHHMKHILRKQCFSLLVLSKYRRRERAHFHRWICTNTMFHLHRSYT